MKKAELITGITVQNGSYLAELLVDKASAPAQQSIQKAKSDTENYTHNVCDPIIHVCAAIKCRLDKFDHTSEGTRPEKYREQSKAASSGEGEG